MLLFGIITATKNIPLSQVSENCKTKWFEKKNIIMEIYCTETEFLNFQGAQESIPRNIIIF